MTIKVYNSKNYPLKKSTGVAGSLLAILDIILLESGWTKEFTGTNTASYRSGTGSNQRYYWINDAGLTTGGLRNAAIRGYSVMTGATDTGTNPFPTTAQASQGVIIRKSLTLDATAREWYAIVSERFCYLFIASETTNIFNPFVFGDFNSYKSLETRNSYVCGYPTDATTFTAGNYGVLKMENLLGNAPGSNYAAGDCNTAAIYDTGAGKDGSRGVTFHSDLVRGGLTSYAGNLRGPISIETKDVRLAKVFIVSNDGTNNIARGEIPGYYHILNGQFSSGVLVGNDGTFPEYSNLHINGILQVGRKFVLINTTNQTPSLWEI